MKTKLKRRARRIRRALQHPSKWFGKKNLGVVCHDHPIADAQTDAIVRGCSRAVALVDSKLSRQILSHVHMDRNLIFIQSHWAQPSAQTLRLISRMRDSHPNSKIVFLDWYAPVHIPHPEMLQAVDLYVKKQALRDRQPYIDGMHDTNLVEYEARWNGHFQDTELLRVDAEELENKLFVGWNFATDHGRIKQLRRGLYTNADRPIDLHCRMCAPDDRSTWYTHMRGRAYDAVQSLRASQHCAGEILCENRLVGYDEYIDEIARSKLCFSPFGYGEVCWRDFEAILAGALLIKPSMDHIETNPNIYIPYETYVPVAWDYSDFESQCLRYLQDETERRRITDNAVRAWREFLSRGWPELWQRMTERLAVEPPSTRALA